MDSWLPKSVLCFRTYTLQQFIADLIAGLTVGLVALPLAMAFAISSGVAPQAGIYTAIVAGFLISALGGSRVQIGGPTGAFVVVVSGIIIKHGMDGLFVCTLMAGVLLVLLGATGLGTAVKFIPRPVVIGFTNGIALLIASTQIKDFFGIRVAKVPGEFYDRAVILIQHFNTLSATTSALSIGALALIILTVRYVKKVPGYIVALVVGTIVVYVFKLPVETIGTRFGGVPQGLPHLHPVHFNMTLARALFPDALTVAMLGAIESLLSAVVGDRMANDKHNPNVELIAQGIANLTTPFFGGLPATGAIARTATSIRSGAQTPVAGMIHAITLLAVIVFAAPLARFVPLAVLAAILFVVSYNMGEWKEIPHLLKMTKADISVWIVTFGLTVFADLTVAVEVGMILAALVYIRKVTQTTTVSEVTSDDIDDGKLHVLQDKLIPEYASVFRIHGPFLFGATDKIADIYERMSELPPIVILRLRNMTALDSTGLQALEDLAGRLKKTNRSLLLCGAREQPARLMDQTHFEKTIGEGNICPHIQAALDRAKELYLDEYNVVPTT